MLKNAIPFGKPFIVGKELFYIDSRGRMSLGINQGNFAEAYKLGEGAAAFIPAKGGG